MIEPGTLVRVLSLNKIGEVTVVYSDTMCGVAIRGGTNSEGIYLMSDLEEV